jgi:hypothetical protein
MRPRAIDASSDQQTFPMRAACEKGTAVTPLGTASQAQHTIVQSLWTAVLLAGLVFVPGGLGFFVEGLSFSTGTALISVVVILLAATGQIPLSVHDVQGTVAIIFVALFVIVTHLLIAYAIDHDPGFDFGRALLSLGLMAVILFSVPAVCKGVMGGQNKLNLIVKAICATFALVAILSFLQIQPPSPSLGSKPTFPYTEPSFLGFSMPAFLIFTLLRSSTPVRLGILSLFLGLGYLLSNLTIIAACGLAAAVSLPISWFAIGIGVIVMSLAGLDITYYTDRLNFDWANSSNLSSLVYVQGWQMLQESLSRTYNWGLGFQQLGVVYTNVPATVRINALLGFDLNIQDGGFVLSKLVSEMGFIGGIIVLVYLYILAKAFSGIRFSKNDIKSMPDGELFARACVIGYSVELLVRGTNYFTGTLVLMISGALYLTARQRPKIESIPVSAV